MLPIQAVRFYFERTVVFGVGFDDIENTFCIAGRGDVYKIV